MHAVWLALDFPWWAQRIASPIYWLFDTEIKRAKTHLCNGKWVNMSLPTEHSAYHASHTNVTHSRKYADFIQRNVKKMFRESIRILNSTPTVVCGIALSTCPIMTEKKN